MAQSQVGMNQNNNPLVDALLAALSKPAQAGVSNQAMQPSTFSNPADVSVAQGQSSSSNPGGMTFSPNPIGNSPQVDLRPIIMRGLQQQQPVPTQIPQEVPVQAIQQTSTEKTGGGFNLGGFLAKLGIPLATAGIGLAVPGALAGASGFNTGYSGEVAKDREMERKQKLNQGFKDTYTFDPDTGEYTATGVKIPKNAQVRNLTSDQQMQLNDKINALLGMDEAKTGDAIKGAQQKTKEVQGNVPAGAAHYSPSTKKYYNAQGQEL